MAQSMCKMMLDVADRDTVQVIVARQGDSATRFLRVRLMSFGEPLCIEENAVVLVNAKNAAGDVRAFEGEVNTDGTVTLPIHAWMLRNVGVVQCDITVVDVNGGKLTTPLFEIDVVASVSQGDVLPGDEGDEESITARLLAEEKLYTLKPELSADGYILSPVCNRKYALDLSDEIYASGDGWKAISLVLPTPTDLDSDNWILIYCHAPLRVAGGVSIDWGVAADLLFVDGEIPNIARGDFDVICTYSRPAGKWQIGTVQYETVEATV
ncbi:MAG: hypothetical protein IJW51_04605 [Clostridia bacterium]|nr:hypothetical protein [Clostridia bacterium]